MTSTIRITFTTVVATVASVAAAVAMPAVGVQLYSNVVRIAGGPQEQSPAFIYPTNVGNEFYFHTLAHTTLTVAVLSGLLTLLLFRTLAGPWNGTKMAMAGFLAVVVVVVAVPVVFAVSITALLGPLMLLLFTGLILWIAIRESRAASKI
jgi:hypothetical protein